jgi:hypothetical protein
MSSVNPIRVTSVRGHVTAGLYAKGSKSEHEAVFIETADGRYVLRRKTGPVFNDTELMQYEGHDVECDGFLIGRTLLAERIVSVD